MADEINILALQRGDVQAFESLVLCYEKKVLNMCWHIMQNKEEAEDITQDIFMTIYQSIHQFKGDAKLSTWIHRITLNKCLESIRKSKRKKRFGIRVEMDESFVEYHISKDKDPEEYLIEKERTTAFLTAVQHLSENQRIAYTLHHMEDFSYKEISENMNLSLSAVESLIFRAKQQLKAQFKEVFKNNSI